MRVPSVTVCLSLCCASALLAQTPTCDQARPPLEMRQCLTAELQEADSGMAALVGRVKASVADSAGRALDEATTAWMAYRREECGALLRSYEGGIEGPVVQLACVVSLTNDRRAHLKRIYAALLR